LPFFSGVAGGQDSSATEDPTEGSAETETQTCIYQRPEEDRSEIEAPPDCNLQLIDPARGNTYYSPYGIKGWHPSSDLEVSGGRLQVITDTGPDIKLIDDFEDGDLSEYEEIPSVGVWQTSTKQAIEGNVSLAVTQDNNSDRPKLLSEQGDGLDYYPQKGDVFSAYDRDSATAGGTQVPIDGFGAAKSTNGNVNGYGIFFFPDSNEVRLVRYDDGSRTDMKTATGSLSLDEWYEIEVKWHNGSGAEPDNTIEVTVYEIDQNDRSRQSSVLNFKTQDSTYANNRGIFWAAFPDTTASHETPVADYYRQIGTV
jgi:hypothetical protein